MDAESGINLIYARTLRAMCISLDSLNPTDCSFHGIVMTHKYRGSQQSLREVKPKFINSTQGKPKNIYKP
jgi:hypothetical protein